MQLILTANSPCDKTDIIMKYIKLLFISFLLCQVSIAQAWQDAVLLIDKPFIQYNPNMSDVNFLFQETDGQFFLKHGNSKFGTQEETLAFVSCNIEKQMD